MDKDEIIRAFVDAMYVYQETGFDDKLWELYNKITDE